MDRREDIRVIVVEQGDLPALGQLLAVVGDVYDPGRPPRRAYEELLGSDSACCLLALAGEQPIGLCVAACVPKLDRRTGFLFIDELLVAKAWRRRDVGRGLIEHAERLAGERGLAGVRLLARPANKTAQRFYAALGFVSNETLFFERSFDRDADQI
jgi:ribosomal protein S18 acetylase RimI-like enzyme